MSETNDAAPNDTKTQLETLQQRLNECDDYLTLESLYDQLCAQSAKNTLLQATIDRWRKVRGKQLSQAETEIGSMSKEELETLMQTIKESQKSPLWKAAVEQDHENGTWLYPGLNNTDQAILDQADEQILQLERAMQKTPNTTVTTPSRITINPTKENQGHSL